MTRGISIAQVDVFAEKPFSGNPAAVCWLTEPADDEWMANVAREMAACPNTAFMIQRVDGSGFDLRWMTAGGVEVALCGHATIAAAHFLFSGGHLAEGAPAHFFTKSGPLKAWHQQDGTIALSFPIDHAAAVAQPPEQIAAGLGVTPVYVGRNRLDFVVEVENEQVLRTLQPDFARLAAVDTRGFVVTSRADGRVPGYDYVLRFFGPRVGVAEDHVTGTAHCALAPYWQARFGNGRTTFSAFQASTRGGLVAVELADDRVIIAGRAIMVMRGELLVQFQTP